MTSKPEAPEEWRSHIPAEDQAQWYVSDAVIYSGVSELDPAELEAARRFLSHWLHEDNHGLRIPATEWGQSLLMWLNVMLKHTGPYQTREARQREYQAKLEESKGKLWRVDLLPDLTALSFPQNLPVYPWLRFYTTNHKWYMNHFRGFIAHCEEEHENHMTLEVTEVKTDLLTPEGKIYDELREEYERESNPAYKRETSAGQQRFHGLLPENFSEEAINELVAKRAQEWEGVA